MTDELLPYYERELTFIRQMAVEFSKKHPGVAGRLLLEPNTCEDPHVERLIEAFALLTGRIHRKLDDEFPEITESLLDVLYPHYLKPIPSFAIAQFRLSPGQSAVADGSAIPAATPLHHVQDGQTCTFRSSYPVQLWPLRVTGASVSTTNRYSAPAPRGDAAAVIRVGLECMNGVRLSQMPLQFLRFYLNGEAAAVQALYELLFANTLHVTLRATAPGATAQAVLPGSALRPVGFSIGEGVLQYSERSFAGYRLLQEYFSFPEKFLFFDLAGLEGISLREFGAAFEIAIALKETPVKHRLTALEQTVDANTFQLGCTPIVNLFERIAEPIRVSHTKSEYRIIPDQHRQASTEIYSVDRVCSMASYQEEPQVYQPLYSLNHSGNDVQKMFWHAHRRASFRKNDEGTEVYLSLVDRDSNPTLSAVDMLTVRVTCTNHDQASRLKLAGEFRELETEGIPLVEARCLRKPTAALRAPRRQSLQWRLISHLSLNHLSIVEKGREALQEILRLYDFGDTAATRKQIDGITAVASKPGIGRVASPAGVAFCRGTDVTIEFDENEYVGGGVFLLASVLQAFLGLYSAVNSFSRLTAKTGKGVLKRWPPLTGEQILL